MHKMAPDVCFVLFCAGELRRRKCVHTSGLAMYAFTVREHAKLG